jgi:hypothetical protein
MPTDPEIFATLGDRVLDYNGRGSILLESKAEYEVLPEDLLREESILRARLSTPYYGKGYERGCWPEIAATLEFLRHRLPGGRVWYGPGGAAPNGGPAQPSGNSGVSGGPPSVS